MCWSAENDYIYADKTKFVKLLLPVILMWVLIFVPAWSLHYWQGWLLMGILFVPMFIAGFVMLWKNPERIIW